MGFRYIEEPKLIQSALDFAKKQQEKEAVISPSNFRMKYFPSYLKGAEDENTIFFDLVKDIIISSIIIDD